MNATRILRTLPMHDAVGGAGTQAEQPGRPTIEAKRAYYEALDALVVVNPSRVTFTTRAKPVESDDAWWPSCPAASVDFGCGDQLVGSSIKRGVACHGVWLRLSPHPTRESWEAARKAVTCGK